MPILGQRRTPALHPAAARCRGVQLTERHSNVSAIFLISFLQRSWGCFSCGDWCSDLAGQKRETKDRHAGTGHEPQHIQAENTSELFVKLCRPAFHCTPTCAEPPGPESDPSADEIEGQREKDKKSKIQSPTGAQKQIHLTRDVTKHRITSQFRRNLFSIVRSPCRIVRSVLL